MLLLFVAVGCAALRPDALEVPPGQRAVLGRVDLAGFEVSEAVLEIVKEDGTFSHDLAIGDGRQYFAIALPPGRYRVLRIRGMKDRSAPSDTIWPLRATFDVGPEPAVYIGTLRIGSRFGRDLRASVVDEYEDTLRILRRLYRDLPEPVARRLLTPA